MKEFWYWLLLMILHTKDIRIGTFIKLFLSESKLFISLFTCRRSRSPQKVRRPMSSGVAWIVTWGKYKTIVRSQARRPSWMDYRNSVLSRREAERPGSWYGYNRRTSGQVAPSVGPQVVLEMEETLCCRLRVVVSGHGTFNRPPTDRSQNRHRPVQVVVGWLPTPPQRRHRRVSLGNIIHVPDEHQNFGPSFAALPVVHVLWLAHPPSDELYRKTVAGHRKTVVGHGTWKLEGGRVVFGVLIEVEVVGLHRVFILGTNV